MDIPVWDKKTDTVSWEGKKIPAETFWRIHNLIKILREFLEVYSRKREDEQKEPLAEYLVRKAEELTDLTVSLSSEAFCQAAGVSMVMERYFYEEGASNLCLDIKNRLIRIRRILFIDELLAQLFEHQEFLRGRVEIKEMVSLKILR